MARLERILQAVMDTPWAILEEKLDAMMEVLVLRSQGVGLNLDAATLASYEAKQEAAQQMRVEGKVAVLPLFGIMARRMGMMSAMSGGVSLEQWQKRFDAAMADPEVRAIVLQVDSPGGQVAGTPELAQHIFASRGKGKRIVAMVDTMAASAAYWVATAADEVVVTPSGYVGSVGVFTVHEDRSEQLAQSGVKYTIIKAGKYKAEGSAAEPLSEGTKEYLQAQVDREYKTFVDALARNRDLPVGKVRADFGEGRLVHSSEARGKGMVDRVATMDETLARLGVGATGIGNVRRQRVEAQAAAHARDVALEERAE